MRHFRSAFVRSVPIARAALIIGAFALASFGPQHSVARAETSVQDDWKQDDLKQNFLKEHELGRRFRIDPADLPAPKTGPIVTNRVLIVPYAGQAPQVPASRQRRSRPALSTRGVCWCCRTAMFWSPNRAPVI